MKKTQLIMVWLLPLIVAGGLFVPLLGYLVVAMMAVFLTMSFFIGRYWCWNLCPRGAFLDIVISRTGLKKPVPQIFAQQPFRWLVFIALMTFVAVRLVRSGGNLIAIGSIFVGMCLFTTAIAIILGLLTRHRGWCVICPMGFLQEKIFNLTQKGGNHR